LPGQPAVSVVCFPDRASGRRSADSALARWPEEGRLAAGVGLSRRCFSRLSIHRAAAVLCLWRTRVYALEFGLCSKSRTQLTGFFEQRSLLRTVLPPLRD